ncbi:hypothetical protein EJ05DRAFT_511843 [Pseudovirgaria hyperparasitica]|uniref:Uncharacterized protein n=1 Tax=Pseudovirgaria hyperparasitica TaxID=470096 RepID=A0A6A6W3G1_9PEZI|nr:uncharacterized protein EJ05DRAFT_511843 [Pseudovirgaria hyperparasitica]KAF2757105.1 hypothetical protein EJ05DRAFT_511843 [Pseudovirgaria hyperparasitica]
MTKFNLLNSDTGQFCLVNVTLIRVTRPCLLRITSFEIAPCGLNVKIALGQRIWPTNFPHMPKEPDDPKFQEWKKNAAHGGKKNAAHGGKKNAAHGGKKNAAHGGKKNAAHGGKKNAAHGGKKNAAHGGKKTAESVDRTKDNLMHVERHTM